MKKVSVRNIWECRDWFLNKVERKTEIIGKQWWWRLWWFMEDTQSNRIYSDYKLGSSCYILNGQSYKLYAWHFNIFAVIGIRKYRGYLSKLYRSVPIWHNVLPCDEIDSGTNYKSTEITNCNVHTSSKFPTNVRFLVQVNKKARVKAFSKISCLKASFTQSYERRMLNFMK